jgi:hypothetical protein
MNVKPGSLFEFKYNAIVHTDRFSLYGRVMAHVWEGELAIFLYVKDGVCHFLTSTGLCQEEEVWLLRRDRINVL